MKLAKDKVSFKIRLAAFQASGWADTWHLEPNTHKWIKIIYAASDVKYL